MMMTAKYVLGIDLGTTNSVVAYAPLPEAPAAPGESEPEIRLLPIPQLVAPSTVETKTSLASFAYLGSEHETRSNALDLPWATGRSYAVGEYARRQSANFPDRTVSAAKSWLCHPKVDRRQPILPWNAGDDVPKISPLTTSRYYLEHLIAAWDQTFPDAPAAKQRVVLTVPASFDASARELTREAALAAGLPADLILLEEPQAALYSWLSQQGDRWRKTLKLDDVLLVCDVGGGTTDLTIVAVSQEGGDLTLRRLAVGNHLLVGGDNMDLALAHHAAQKFTEQGKSLNPWQTVSLWHAARVAKETLLAEDAPGSHPVSIQQRGSKLVGGTISVDLTRDEAQSVLADGFFPQVGLDARPERRRASGFQEIGLPFEADPAITKHLAAFLAAQAGQGDDSGTVRPTHVLLNGGVFRSAVLRDRLRSTLAGWFGGKKNATGGPELLEAGVDLDNAVARGAAYYGFSKERGGIRIRGGTARSYYVGIESAGLAIPGAPRPLAALCVVPFGMEEGTEADVPSREIGLAVGEPEQFRFFSSGVRQQDKPGVTLQHWDAEELVETDPLEATLAAPEGHGEAYVPVKFQSRVTELGMLELWCVDAQDADRKWKLEFKVRED